MNKETYCQGVYKTEKVILGCKTIEQLDSAANYLKLWVANCRVNLNLEQKKDFGYHQDINMLTNNLKNCLFAL